MEMHAAQLAAELESSFAVLEAQFRGVELELLRFKPAPETWSMLEVLVHLWEEEHLDFRPRLASTLEDPERQWVTIDPEGWVAQRRYNERHPAEALEGFRTERATSLAWLRGLEAPAWDHVYSHPMGKIRAGDLMVSWLVHDHIHTRQVANLRCLWLPRHAEPYSTRYAMP